VSTQLSIEDACKLVDVLIDVLPEAKKLGVQGAMTCAIHNWPDTDWREVVRVLRDAPNDVRTIANWLDEALRDDEARLRRLGRGVE